MRDTETAFISLLGIFSDIPELYSGHLQGCEASLFVSESGQVDRLGLVLQSPLQVPLVKILTLGETGVVVAVARDAKKREREREREGRTSSTHLILKEYSGKKKVTQT